MIALLQRVTQAYVDVDGTRIAQIGMGVLVFVAVEPDDGAHQARALAQRVLGYRVFPDAGGRMNRSVRDVDGESLWVPQFTLAADTCGGTRPSLSGAASPEAARGVFEDVVAAARACQPKVACGAFGADMQVGLVNDGPVTFWLRVE